MTTLYGAPLSPFVRKTMLVLAHKGVEYDQVIVAPENRSADFYKISPLGKIPAYKDDRVVLCDSTVICEYLEDKYPNPEILPFGAAQRAHTRWYEEYADTKLASLCAEKIFRNRVLNPLVAGKPSDEDTVEKTLKEELPAALDYLEIQLSDKRYFVAGMMTAADFAIISQLLCLRVSEVSVDISKWPRLGAYIGRLCARDIFKNQIRIEDEIIDSLKARQTKKTKAQKLQ